MDRSAPLTVSELTHHIKSALENAFPPLWVEGEVSGLRRATSGHCYFTLKDSHSQIPAVLFRRQVSALDFEPADGMQVLVYGRISVYEARGAYQILVEDMEPRGVGALREALDRLRLRLADEGVFDQERKRPLPAPLRRVGIVTSATGAAIKDILKVLEDRDTGVDVLLSPALVQGPGAPASILAALNLLAKRKDIDLVIVGRGGGSFEDLLAFSDEEVVRAVAAFPRPVVSAVGHEIDTTLCDLAADLRAPTPTAAAQIVAAGYEASRQQMDDHTRRAVTAMERILEEAGSALARLAARLTHPSHLIEQGRMRVDDLSFRLSAHMGDRLKVCRSELRRLGEVLRTLGPQAILDRGYAVVMKADGRVVRSHAEVEIGEGLDLRLARGGLGVKVTRK